MKQLLLVLFLTLTPAAYLTAATVKGWVKDAQTGEELIGAAVYVKENPAMGTTAGLDGTFVLKDVPEGKNITLVCSYISYETQEQNVNTLSGRDVLFNMKPSAMNLEGVTIIAANPGRTEAGARGIECGQRHECESDRAVTGYYGCQCDPAYVRRDGRA